MRTRWLELGLVLLVAIAPLWVSSFHAFLKGGTLTDRDTAHYMNAVVHEAAALCLLAYVLRRSRRGWKDIGLRVSIGQVGIGICLFIATSVLTAAGYYVLQYAHFAVFGAWARPWDLSGILGTTSLWVLVPFILLNPWFEESIVRGYLMTELQALTGSSLAAVLISTLLQAGYHLYQGTVNATMVGISFLVLSLYYLKTRELLPVIVAHTIMDAYAITMLLYRLSGR